MRIPFDFKIDSPPVETEIRRLSLLLSSSAILATSTTLKYTLLRPTIETVKTTAYRGLRPERLAFNRCPQTHNLPLVSAISFYNPYLSLIQKKKVLVTALLIIGLVVVASALVAVFALTCVRPSTEYSFQHRTSSSISGNSSRMRNPKKRLIRFDNGAPFGRSGLPGSDSLPESLSISASQPTAFGDSNYAGGLVKVVLTPPTPTKRGRRTSLVNLDDEDGI